MGAGSRYRQVPSTEVRRKKQQRLRHVVDAAFGMLDEADALVVLGSSLTVFSGYRFVLRAAERGVPVAIVNRGVTRGDPHATLKLDTGVAEALAPWAPRQESPT
mgnify:CR=1 FL=1